MDTSVPTDLDVEGSKTGSLEVLSAIDKNTQQNIRRLCMYKVFDVASTSFSKFRAKARAPWPAIDLSDKAVNRTDPDDVCRPRKGGWLTAPLIFGTEICEKIAASGLQANLVTFLVQQLHMQTVEAANTITNFNGSANLSPIFGAYLADAYIGRFQAIVLGSLFYLVGVVLFALDAAVPSLKPPPCPYDQRALGQHCIPASLKQKAFLYMSFAFLVFGSGFIRPCVAAFGADQFDQTDPEEKKKSAKFFNWYYFSLGLSLLFAVTVLVYIQDNVGWSLGFGIPAILMALSLTCFLCGYKLYRHSIGNGNPFIRLAQVCVSAYRNRNQRLPEDTSELYWGTGEDGTYLPLRHSDQFRFLDKAAILNESIMSGESNATSNWKLCTVHQVEELKCLLRILPIWATGILFTTSHAQQGTFMVQQARTMDRHIGSRLQLPPASFSVFSLLTLLIWVPFYDRTVVPAIRRLTGKERGITFLQRIGTGLFISVLAMLVAGATERYRRHAAMRAGLIDLPHAQVPISAFWLVPQYCLLGFSESFVLIGHLELFYDQFPENMRSLAGALFSSSAAVGSYSSSIIVELIQKYSDKGSGNLHSHQRGWMSSNLNRGHLDYFYWLIGSLGAINFVAFLLSARWYKYKTLH